MAIEAAIALDSTRCIRWGDWLAAENAGHANLAAFAWGVVVFAQAVAYLRQQRVVRHCGKVSNIDLMGVAFAAGCTHGDEQPAGITRPLRHGSFGVDLVAGIHHALHVGR